jgi:hypothetical protein
MTDNKKTDNKKTLVIHIKDRTTDFLKEIYKDIPCTVIQDGCSGDIIREIKKHDRIIMCGHGCASGLFGKRGMIISDFAVPYLQDKECIFIWCNADKFVNRHNLSGFYTGMFISEVAEAAIYGIHVSEEDVYFSNYFFSRMVGKCLKDGMTANEIFFTVKSDYIDKNNMIVSFNNTRMYFAEVNNNIRAEYRGVENKYDGIQFYSEYYEDDYIYDDPIYDDPKYASEYDSEYDSDDYISGYDGINYNAFKNVFMKKDENNEKSEKSEKRVTIHNS